MLTYRKYIQGINFPSSLRASSLSCAAAEAPDVRRDDELSESPDDGRNDELFPNTGAAAQAPSQSGDDELFAGTGACSSLI